MPETPLKEPKIEIEAERKRFPIKAAWRESLPKIPWTIFFTGTFEKPIYEGRIDKARAAWLRIVREISEDLYYLGPRKRVRRQVPFLLSIESHQSGNVHVHAAIAEFPAERAQELQDRWNRLFGLAKSEKYDRQKDGIGYVLKHADDEGVWVEPNREALNYKKVS